MTDEMEPKLRERTAIKTLQKCIVYTRHESSTVYANKGYKFTVYIDGEPWDVGIFNKAPGKKGKYANWVVSDLYTGLAISRHDHESRQKALHAFFNTYEFDRYSNIVKQSRFANFANWYGDKAQEFADLAHLQGYTVPGWEW